MSKSIDVVAKAVADVTGLTDIELSEDLIKSGKIDSFGILQLILAIESDLKVNLENDDLNANNFRSIKTISQMLDKKNTS